MGVLSGSGRVVQFEQDGAVGMVLFNRPERLNAFTQAMHVEMCEVLDAVEALAAQGRLRALRLSGAGKAFCAGQDLNERRREPGSPPPDLGRSCRENFNPLILRLSRLPVPVVAAVNGVAAGAGLGLALACDVVIAASCASFRASFGHVGLAADSGVSWALPRRVGMARATAMILLCESLTATEALTAGLVYRVVDEDALTGVSGDLTRQLAARATCAVALQKQLLAGTWERSLETQLEQEATAQQVAGRTADYLEGVESFLGKRPAIFNGN